MSRLRLVLLVVTLLLVGVVLGVGVGGQVGRMVRCQQLSAQYATVFRFSRGDKTEELEGRPWAPGVVAEGGGDVGPAGVSE